MNYIVEPRGNLWPFYSHTIRSCGCSLYLYRILLNCQYLSKYMNFVLIEVPELRTSHVCSNLRFTFALPKRDAYQTIWPCLHRSQLEHSDIILFGHCDTCHVVHLQQSNSSLFKLGNRATKPCFNCTFSSKGIVDFQIIRFW